MDKILFIREFFKNWREVGSITPSSPFLVNKMLKRVDFENAKIIVELGPGSGCVTKKILKKMRPDAKLYVFETNKDFCFKLKQIKDAKLIVCNESALNLSKRLGDRVVDYIISGIPLATLQSKNKNSLLAEGYRVLTPRGYYIQFQYSLESYKDLNSVYDKVSLGFTPLNIPPAFVYSCLKR